MSRPPLEVADLIRTAGAAFIERNREWIVNQASQECASQAGSTTHPYSFSVVIRQQIQGFPLYEASGATTLCYRGRPNR